MTATTRGPAALIIATVLLAATGMVLIGIGTSSSPTAVSTPGPESPATPVVPTSRSHPGAAERSAAAGSSASVSASSPSASPPGRQNLPPSMSGPEADPVVQRALDDAVPPDLPTDIANEVAELGVEVWLAEVTGRGRERWPDYFTDRGARTAFYTRVRVQAAIGRKDPVGPGAVVHLVWAGAGPAGTFMDGRTATVRFIRDERSGTWTPQR
ncbi:hypothetical protein GCM10010264_72320 [Streptomyces globisporus]|uniref:hypothetical protein n=1 Tax=Streptomyces globisporus TaxID=1908 RepID=UPI00177E9101|nr:hypothetical protein GCM10010264_72320 [Streptomyces globisporus]